jgi:hypothetical protein
MEINHNNCENGKTGSFKLIDTNFNCLNISAKLGLENALWVVESLSHYECQGCKTRITLRSQKQHFPAL